MKTISRYLLSCILILSPGFSLFSTTAAQAPTKQAALQSEQNLEPTQLGEEVQQQIEAILQEKQNLTPEQRKIDSQLRRAIQARQGPAFTSGAPRLPARVEVDTDGKTIVEIRLKTAIAEELLELLRNIEGEVLATTPEKNLIRARLPVDLLEPLAGRAEIRSIRKPPLALTNRGLARSDTDPQATPVSPQQELLKNKAARLREQLKQTLPALAATEAPAATEATTEAIVTGPPVTQGDAAHKANLVRDVYGVDGTGVKIGVLSDSVRYLERSQANGNLPNDVTVLPGQSGIQRDNSDQGEGTAMLEIIYDIAPGAKLFFATGVSSPDSMAQNIRDLRFKYGCDIIVDDIGWTDQLAFQDYTLAQAANDVTKAGALYFSSAGNAGNYNDGTSGTWQGDFKNVGRPGISVGPTGDPLYTFHDFGGGLISNRISRTFGDGFAFIRLFWSDPADASDNDYDLYVLDATLTRIRDFSIDVQEGDGFPGEFVANFFQEGDRILIANYSGAKPRALYLDTFGTAEMALTTGGAITGQAAAAEAFAVGAVPASVARNGVFIAGPTTPVEPFSSDGPRHIFFNADGSPVTPGKLLFEDGGIVRQKPEFAAADGVSTSLPQPFFSTFFGTSAAAPHAAAIAALVKSAVPDITKETMREVLTSTALDIGPTGWDRVAGAGVLSALNAYLKAKPSPFLEFASVEASAGTGDGDNAIEPGEEGLLQVALVNNGTAPATGVTARISTTTPGVTITTADSEYPTIPEGKGGVNLRHFRFRLAANATCGLRPTFTIAVSSNQTLARNFSFAVQTGQPATTPVVARFANLNIPIPEGFTQSLTFTLSGATSPLTRVAFRFDGSDCTSPTGVGLQHDRVSDLVFTLTSPSGTTVTLFSNPGGLGLPSKNFCNTLLDDSGATSIQNLTTAGAPYSGTFRPSGRFATLNGQSANGTWVLRVTDRVLGTTGTLRNFSLLLYTYGCDANAAAVAEASFGER